MKKFLITTINAAFEIDHVVVHAINCHMAMIKYGQLSNDNTIQNVWHWQLSDDDEITLDERKKYHEELLTEELFETVDTILVPGDYVILMTTVLFLQSEVTIRRNKVTSLENVKYQIVYYADALKVLKARYYNGNPARMFDTNRNEFVNYLESDIVGQCPVCDSTNVSQEDSSDGTITCHECGNVYWNYHVLQSNDYVVSGQTCYKLHGEIVFKRGSLPDIRTVETETVLYQDMIKDWRHRYHDGYMVKVFNADDNLFMYDGS